MRFESVHNWDGMVKLSAFPLVLRGASLETVIVSFDEATGIARVQVGEDNSQTWVEEASSLTDAADSKWPLTIEARLDPELQVKLEALVQPGELRFSLRINGVDYEDLDYTVVLGGGTAEGGEDEQGQNDGQLTGVVSLNDRLLYQELTLPYPWSTQVGKYHTLAALAGQPLQSIRLDSISCADSVLTDLVKTIVGQLEATSEHGLKSLNLSFFRPPITVLDEQTWTQLASRCSLLQELTVKSMSTVSPECRQALSRFICHVISASPPLKKLNLDYFC